MRQSLWMHQMWDGEIQHQQQQILDGQHLTALLILEWLQPGLFSLFKTMIVCICVFSRSVCVSIKSGVKLIITIVAR